MTKEVRIHNGERAVSSASSTGKLSYTEINEIKNESIEKIKKTKSWFFEKVRVINKPLAKITKKGRKHKLLISEMKEGTSL